MKFREEVSQKNFDGINKPMAKKALVDFLDDVIERLGK